MNDTLEGLALPKQFAFSPSNVNIITPSPDTGVIGLESLGPLSRTPGTPQISTRADAAEREWWMGLEACRSCLGGYSILFWRTKIYGHRPNKYEIVGISG